ncbi:molybdopterin-binding protein [Cloacibacillus porcorum]|uniref:molybdopterin-binding protein n=1 Tax=Cloacibacillus porcorum TaxID=1197717 RepID=UPI0023F08EEA|nr:molybdopterin-binding protein [Cloacibacillus porcorum]MDD7649611.1 molybdopterin-binding protein [Cloacibacillus porcorum]MDY4092491.1 molybdopterin-binding protein [Cloacibacillus porcorum]
MKITTIPLEEAIGLPLAHDLTQIDAKNHKKSARFKKGQVITEADLETLRAMGRENLSIMEMSPGDVHEDDAARQLGEVLCGDNLRLTEPSEGRCNLVAESSGILWYLAETVNRVNQDPDWVLSALAPHRPVLAGQVVAGFRIRPLVMEDYRVERAVAAVRGSKPFTILPFMPLKVGLITTGKEIVDKKVEDAFRPKLLEKLSRLNGSLMGQRFCTDSLEQISEAIAAFLNEGADVIICTGGMSVDADDKTPGAIRSRCRKISFQGTPALPGAMLMLGWAASPENGRDVAVIGAPACVAFDERTALDKLLPFVFAGIEPGDLVRRWGVGGLCEHCPTCHYPACSFAAGS